MEKPSQASKKKAASDDKLLVKAKSKAQILNERRELNNDSIRLHNFRFKCENWLRLLVAAGVFVVVIGWLMAVLVVLILQGVSEYSPKLSDNVLIAMLATTTVNVIGLLSAVVLYLFPKGDKVASTKSKDRHRTS